MNFRFKLASHTNNKKLKKLILQPRKYFADIGYFSPVYQKIGIFQEPKLNVDAPLDLMSNHQSASIEFEEGPLSCFDLVGDNWLDNQVEKPLIVLWNFTPWKREFMARYLQEYRVAFARGKTSWEVQKKALDQLLYSTFGFWGKGESDDVRIYAEDRGWPILRIEDGFIRSAELGSLHTLPMSLAIDKTGIYFDATKNSDLEKLLLTYNFESNKKLLKNAAELRKIFCGIKLSKYNLSGFQSIFNILGPKIKKRVLVLGQVELDASIRYGMAEEWTSKKLLKLAKDENLHAEIIYKPHPDVIQGFRSNSEGLKELQAMCNKVLLEDLVLGELLTAVDHVYTITSLSGLEALLHGCKVTVVGAPFYAGWGLTDDRQKISRRDRQLTIDELFCGVYLLYPKYITKPEDSVTGCLASILRIVAQREQKLLASVTPKLIERKHALLAKSAYWPVLFRTEHLPGLMTKYEKKLLSVLPVSYFFSECDGAIFQKSLAYFLVGRLHGSKCFTALLPQLRTLLRAEIFEQLIIDLWEMKPSDFILDQWATHCESINRYDDARRTLEHLSSVATVAASTEKSLPIPAGKQASVLKLAQYELRYKNFEKAEKLFNQLLLSGNNTGEVFSGLAEIARLRFEFDSSSHLMGLFNCLTPLWKAGRGYLMQAQAAALSGQPWKALELLASACLINPQYVESVASVTDVLERHLGLLPYAEAMQAAVEVMDDGKVIGRAKGLIAQHRPADAERILLTYTPTPAETVKYCLMLSLSYSYQGKLEQAKHLIQNLLEADKSLLVYREGLRVAVVKNDYVWGKQLLDEAAKKDLDVGDIYERKIGLGLKNIADSYLSFRKIKATKTLQSYFGARYVQSLDELCKGNQVTILAFFGPGDEIRFSSFYAKFSDYLQKSKLSITCDPRIYLLLRRGYPNLKFVPVERIRSLAWLDNFSNFNKLPGSDLHTFIDNNGLELVEKSDRVALVTDLLGDLMYQGYDSFTGTAYLKSDEDKVLSWKKVLKSHTNLPLIGLSWRSSLTTYSRNEHYLSVEDLIPILELDNVQFVNLQYDECTDELAWIEERFPGKVLNFPNVDQYNDLDEVAALMCSFDLVVAPATTVVELAGALGCPTLMLSNSSELYWRKRPGTSVDVWHQSIIHIEGNSVGDKFSLVANTKSKIQAFFQK